LVEGVGNAPTQPKREIYSLLGSLLPSPSKIAPDTVAVRHRLVIQASPIDAAAWERIIT